MKTPKGLERVRKTQMGLVGQIIKEGNKPAVGFIKRAGLWDKVKDKVMEGWENRIPKLEKRVKKLKKMVRKFEEKGMEERAEDYRSKLNEAEHTLNLIREMYQEELVKEEMEEEEEFGEEVTEEMGEEYEEEGKPPEKQKKIEKIHELEERIERLKKELKG